MELGKRRFGWDDVLVGFCEHYGTICVKLIVDNCKLLWENTATYS